MCVLIVAPKGKIVPNLALFNGWSSNRDGGGFCYVDEKDEVVIKKGFDKYNDFQRAYEEAAKQYSETSPFLVHMRIKSQGDKGMKNTHPFAFTPTEGPAGALGHNGTMFSPQGASIGTEDDKKSDTRVFAELLGSKLVFEDVKSGLALLTKAIGYSRMAFLYANREFLIVNEKTNGAKWEDGIWYSNNSCAAESSARWNDYTR